jgi:hypothetical protein
MRSPDQVGRQLLRAGSEGPAAMSDARWCDRLWRSKRRAQRQLQEEAFTKETQAMLRAARALEGNKIWRPGLRYEDFLPGMILDMSRSKTSVPAIFDVREYPLLMRALEAVPEAERTGPVAVTDSCEPFKKRYYQRLYAELAAAAGVPKGVWNMAARHGGGTEAQKAGVPLEDTSAHGQTIDDGRAASYAGCSVLRVRLITAPVWEITSIWHCRHQVPSMPMMRALNPDSNTTSLPAFAISLVISFIFTKRHALRGERLLAVKSRAESTQRAAPGPHGTVRHGPRPV